MASFLRSIFNKTEPDILDSLKGLKDIEEVTDYCFFDAEANVVGMLSKYGNEKSLFSVVGKEAARTALLLDAFAKWNGSETKHCHIRCRSGIILLWNFGGSFLMVLLNGTKQIPVVRMTVNIFKEKASGNNSFEKYFQEPEPSTVDFWNNDHDLNQCKQSIFGTQPAEEV